MQNKKSTINSHQNAKTRNHSKIFFWCPLVSLCFGGKITFKLITLTLLTSLTFSCSIFKKAQDEKVDEKQETQQQTVKKSAKDTAIKAKGLQPIQTTGEFVKQDETMYPEFVDSLKNGLVKEESEDKTYYFKGEVLDSIPEIVHEVLPDVYFFKGMSYIAGSTPSTGKAAYYKGKQLSALHDFNNLYYRMDHDEQITLNKKLLAIFIIRHGMSKNKNIKIANIEPIEKKKIEKASYFINYKVTVSVNGTNRTWYFFHDNGQILHLGYYSKHGIYQRIIIHEISMML